MQYPKLAVKANWNRADVIQRVNEVVAEVEVGQHRPLLPIGAGVAARTIWISASNSRDSFSTHDKRDKTFIRESISTTVTSAVR